MSFLTPDLTGNDVTYKVDNFVTTIFKTPQVVELGTVAFEDNLVISLVGTTSHVTPIILVKGHDYVINDTDIDYSTMGHMKTYDPTFSKTLITSITLLKNISTTSTFTNFVINISHQRLYPNQVQTAYFNGEPLNFTPELLSGMLQMLHKLDLRTSRVVDSTLDDTTSTIYEEDPFMENTLNVVEGELHDVDTTNGKIYIHPLAGAFFKDSIKVYNNSTNQELVKDTDYKIYGLDLHKTSLTNQTGGVYNFVIFIKAFIGIAKINYHAFGGDPTISNIKELRLQNENIMKYLNEATFITEQTLSTTTVMGSLIQRMISLEDQMRRLLITGKPSYGDSTDGATVLKKITASGDNGLHWWNIAYLYKVSGSDDIVIADRGMYRFETLYTKFMFDAIITVNLNNSNKDLFSVNILSNNYPRGYIPFEDYSGVDSLIRPQFRAIWNTNSSNQSGIIIQMGMELKTVATETLVISDRSGKESCITLYPEVEDSLSPNDDLITLPNTAHIWSTSNVDSVSSSTLVPFLEGHLVWAGTKALNRPTGDWQSFSLTDHFLDNYTDITRIKKVRLELSEVGTEYEFPIDVNFIPGLTKLVGMTNFHYDREAASVNIEIYKDTNGDIQFDFNTQVVAGADSNQLDLRGVVIYV